MAATARDNLLIDLEDAIAHGSADKRIRALREVTDLFLAGADRFDDTVIGLFDDVIGRLATAIETAARAELAERLAPEARAPANLMRDLASDHQIEVARPVLELSPVLTDQDLVSIARTQSQSHLAAIAGRASIAPIVTDVLVARGGAEVVQTVAGNAGARFSPLGITSLVERADQDEVLQLALGRRRDLPPHLFRTLVARATQAVQSRLLTMAAPGDAREVQRVLTTVADRIGVRAQPKARDFTAAKQTVQGLKARSLLNESQLVAFAKDGQLDELLVGLATLTGVPVEVAERLVGGTRPDPILILGKATGFSWQTVRAIIQAQPGGAGTSTSGLEATLANFNALSPQTAQRVVRFWQVRQHAGGAPAGG